ncbi:hypothetical protein, partial [Pedobacter sp.]|uniref:hypothetical protein n=1 Tax=Pedobacter sp. TaxID=1411316 RepID=UPI002CC4D1D2
MPIINYDLWGADSGKAFMSRLVLFVLIILAGFRFRVGSDTMVYMKEYENILSLDRIGLKYLFQF